MKCQPQTITNTRTNNFHGIEPKAWNLQGWKIKLTSRPATEQPTKIHSNTETALNVHSLSGFVCLRLDVQFKHAISFEGGELADVELLDLQRRVSFSFCGNPTLLGEDFPCMFIWNSCAGRACACLWDEIKTSSLLFVSGAMPFAFSIKASLLLANT
ncbi:hypothetical protein SLA2020_525340 [Shorea laevis]